jgi:hypothetical protein
MKQPSAEASTQPPRGSIERILRHMAFENAKFEPFNFGFVRCYMKRPGIDVSKLEGLNRFFAEGGPAFNAPFLYSKNLYDEAVEMFEYATQELGTPSGETLH